MSNTISRNICKLTNSCCITIGSLRKGQAAVGSRSAHLLLASLLSDGLIQPLFQSMLFC